MVTEIVDVHVNKKLFAMRKGWIYLIGVVLLGLGYSWLKLTFSDAGAFTVSIVYLLVLRLLAEKFGNPK